MPLQARNTGRSLKRGLFTHTIQRLVRHRVNTYLFLLFIEVINDDTNKQVECEKGSKDDEKDEVKVHVNVDFTYRLLAQL